MGSLESLPPRPLRESEVATLNRSAGIDYAVATERDGPTSGLIIATERWVKGLALIDDRWQSVASEPLSESPRPDALRQCEEAVLASLSDGS